MLPSIRASVSPDTINRVGRLFNNSLPDALGELLQNARRAGATNVEIELRRDDHVVLSIADDGIGIIDPASVITLGRSDWDSSIATREDPAGMGMFSLAGHAVTIVSRHADHANGWTVHIPADAWDGSCDLPLEAADRSIGTTIEIRLPIAWDDHVDRLVSAAALHYPLPVHFNGAECKREDWLADAIHRCEWHGSTIGIFAGEPRFSSASLNFHGVTVPCRLPTVSEVSGGIGFHARVDIHDSPALQLVLPARKEAVENDALTNLRVAVERAIYLAIGQRPMHQLPYTAWTRARELGVKLSEAHPELHTWHPAIAYSTSDLGLSKPIAADGAILFAGTDPDTEQCIARALSASPLRAQMADELAAYRGYSWYDRLPRIDNFRFDVEHQGGTLSIADAATSPAITDHLLATRITLRADLHDNGQVNPIVEETDVALVSNPDYWDGLDAACIVYRDALTPDDLTDLLDAAYFSASNDVDCNSWESQHRDFVSDARQCAVKLLCGPDEAVCDQFRRLLADNCWILPKGASVQLSMADDYINVALAREPAGAA